MELFILILLIAFAYGGAQAMRGVIRFVLWSFFVIFVLALLITVASHS